MSKRYATMTNAELIAEQERIYADPANRAPEGEFNLYTKAAQKKLGLIAEWITHNMIEKKKADGTYIFTGGYSGRKQKKRR